MKLLALLTLLVGMSAQASQLVGPQSSWEDIKAAGLTPGFSTIFFGKIGVTVDELCIDGANLRPVQPYRSTCVEYDRKFNRCIKEASFYLSTPIVHNEYKCVKYNNKKDDCREWGAFETSYPTVYNVTVYSRTAHDDDFKPMFNKVLEIPACQ